MFNRYLKAFYGEKNKKKHKTQGFFEWVFCCQPCLRPDDILYHPASEEAGFPVVEYGAHDGLIGDHQSYGREAPARPS